jgi:hypothetical protein
MWACLVPPGGAGCRTSRTGACRAGQSPGPPDDWSSSLSRARRRSRGGDRRSPGGGRDRANWPADARAGSLSQATGSAGQRPAMRACCPHHGIRPSRPTSRSRRGDPAAQREARPVGTPHSAARFEAPAAAAHGLWGAPSGYGPGLADPCVSWGRSDDAPEGTLVG